MPPGAVQGNIECGTPKYGVVDAGKLTWINPQLRTSHNRIHADVNKGGDRHRPRDGKTVFEICNQAGIPAGEYNPLHRNRNGVRAPQRVAWIFRDHRAIRVLQCDGPLVRKERHRRHGSDIETAYVVFTAQIEALEGGRYHAAVPSQERALHVESDRVAAFLHGDEVLV